MGERIRPRRPYSPWPGERWKPGRAHPSRGATERIGPTHFDVYHTNKAGKRDRHHSEDVKISGEPHKPSMRDIHPSKK